LYPRVTLVSFDFAGIGICDWAYVTPGYFQNDDLMIVTATTSILHGIALLLVSASCFMRSYEAQNAETERAKAETQAFIFLFIYYTDFSTRIYCTLIND